MNRVLRVARLQLVGWRSSFVWPTVILFAVFAINSAVFHLIADGLEDEPVTGGLASVYITFLAFGAIAITQYFPFSLGMGVTRRTFYVATVLLIAAESVAFGLLLYALNSLEHATDGWGISMRFFGVAGLDQGNPVAQLLVYTVPFLLTGFIGVWYGVVFTRWHSNGVMGVSLALIVLVGGLVLLVSWLRAWDSVGSWLGDQSAVALYGGWTLLPALALAAAGYLALRRTPA